MSVTVRTIRPDEVDAWTRAVFEGFLAHADDEALALRREHTDPDRAWAAFDEDRVVGTLRSFPAELTVPGGRPVAASSVTAVAVLATHRRRGLLTRMVDGELAASRDRGEVVSVLIASEWPIYGRFGFGPATELADLTVDARAARFAGDPPEGTVELVTPDELRRHAPAIYEQVRAARVGEVSRQGWLWDFRTGVRSWPGEPPWKGFQALHRDGSGAPAGYVRYTVEDRWSHRRPEHVLTVEELCATTPAATEALWRFCCAIDWVATVKAANRWVEEPLPHLLVDGRAVTCTDRGDFLWVRLLDVAAALSARTYLVDGSVVLEVVDRGSAERFHLEGGPDGATCRPTGATPDLTVTAGALGAAFLGGPSLRTLAAAGAVTEHAPGALARAATMFRGEAAPWCATWF